jgi:hypothetical protein
MFELVEKGSKTHPDFMTVSVVVAVVGDLVADLLFELRFRSLFGRLQKNGTSKCAIRNHNCSNKKR